MSTKSAEVAEYKEKSHFVEQCNPITGPSVFCVDTKLRDAREGPFILYSIQPKDTATRALYRCYSFSSARHYLSAKTCESKDVSQVLLGYIAINRGGEMLRGLYRCRDPKTGRRFHALDLACDYSDLKDPLGYVR